MELDDISGASFNERMRCFLKAGTGKTGGSPDLTQADMDYARHEATEEMLNEIHAMLRALLKL